MQANNENWIIWGNGAVNLALRFLLTFIFALFLLPLTACDGSRSRAAEVRAQDDGSYLFTAADGRRLRVRAYGEHMLRLQSARAGEDFFADDRYEMVERHDWPSRLALSESKGEVRLGTAEGLTVIVDKQSLAARFEEAGQALLAESAPVSWRDNTIATRFTYDPAEHFTGLGHGYFARAESLDLRGRKVRRNYGSSHLEQAPLIVPFYLSSKGYGVFLNSTFANTFNFGEDSNYGFAIDDNGFGGRMDYFFIAGPKLGQVLDRYTQLTGRPRLPMKAMFGLQLSDKGHDHNSATPSDEQWWRRKVAEHRAAGFPLDHLVNDNRWRAAGGQRCVSKLAWDPERYPDPEAYGAWLKAKGLVMTLDFNRCIAQFSDGWKAAFNLPESDNIDFADSAPDLTNAEFRRWFWDIFYRTAFDPALGYPGEALWIDEFDEQGAAPLDMVLANGRSSAEMRNYWFFLIAKALVQQGWDKSGIERRPFVWVRGMTAGAQRYATLWSGDIEPSYKDMRSQIRGMQLAGLSGFPFWGHDAGGFHDWERGLGPDDPMYVQWSMAYGSFAPIWKPHGMGQSRWPLDRPQSVQTFAHYYARLRYELMPYLYSAAHRAAASGLPMARPMLLAYPREEQAWKRDLQYLWGDDFLVAPNTADDGEVEVWLPEGGWVDYHSRAPIGGGRVLKVPAPLGTLPLFVRQGAVIPRRDYALSTAFVDKSVLLLEVYAGASGCGELIEDDDVSEGYRKRGEIQRTALQYDQPSRTLTIGAAEGSYRGAPTERNYKVRVIGDPAFVCAEINGEKLSARTDGDNALLLDLGRYPLRETLQVRACDPPILQARD